MIFSVFIINKAGGLIYHQDFSKSSKRTANDDLVMAGTFHGVHAITSQISPQLSSTGIDMLEAESFKLCCFQTLTGIKFLAQTDPNHPNPDIFLRKLYEVYADYGMKNPFHTPEMPIRAELFHENLVKLANQK